MFDLFRRRSVGKYYLSGFHVDSPEGNYQVFHGASLLAIRELVEHMESPLVAGPSRYLLMLQTCNNASTSLGVLEKYVSWVGGACKILVQKAIVEEIYTYADDQDPPG